jgi:hypothetical protein
LWQKYPLCGIGFLFKLISLCLVVGKQLIYRPVL